MKLTHVVLGSVLVAAALAPAKAHAQGGVGLRVGVSGDPDQVYVGAHVDVGPIEGSLWLRPNLELGFGDGVTLVAVNGELAYWLRPRRSPWRIYLGFGPALNIYSWSRDDPPFRDDTDIEPGLNILVGVVHRGSFFAEVKLGALDSPEVKFALGWTFH